MFGLGLRTPHYEALANGHPDIDWLELITENYLVPGGPPLRWADRLREHFPMALHGVSLSIGGTDPLDLDYLGAVRTLIRRLRPMWVSDHLCWTGIMNRNLHDLFPLPFTDEALAHVIERVGIVQDILGRRILLENVSSYVSFDQSTLTEWDFLAAVANAADCELLLDVNNVYVSSVNHGWDPRFYVDRLPLDRVRQIHLAGHQNCGTHIIDTHDAAIVEEVWELYGHVVAQIGHDVPVLIERDDNIPQVDALVAELRRARHHASAIAGALP